MAGTVSCDVYEKIYILGNNTIRNESKQFFCAAEREEYELFGDARSKVGARGTRVSISLALPARGTRGDVRRRSDGVFFKLHGAVPWELRPSIALPARVQRSVNNGDSISETSDVFGTQRIGYVTGSVQLRVKFICVAVDSRWPVYAQLPTAAEEQGSEARCLEYAQDQLRRLDSQIAFSTYGKLRVTASPAVAVAVARDSREHSFEEDICFNTARLQVEEAALLLEANSSASSPWEDVDIPYWLLPEHAQHDTCTEMLGVCYIGLLHPLATQSISRNDYWKRGCFSLREPSRPTHSTRVHAHEIGHALGLGHAAGAGEFRSNSVSSLLDEYGDSSAIMGNDIDALNTFSPPARYHLGAIPASAIATRRRGQSDLRGVKLRQLSDLPGLADDEMVAAVVRCLACSQRSTDRSIVESSLGGGDLWITLRGGEVYHPPWASNLTDGFHRNSDHAQRSDAVVVDYRPSTRVTHSQQLYWLRENEEFVPAFGGPTIRVLSLRPATSTSPAFATIDILGGFAPTAPPTPPSPPAPPASPHDDGATAALFVFIIFGFAACAWCTVLLYATVLTTPWNQNRARMPILSIFIFFLWFWLLHWWAWVLSSGLIWFLVALLVFDTLQWQQPRLVYYGARGEEFDKKNEMENDMAHEKNGAAASAGPAAGATARAPSVFVSL